MAKIQTAPLNDIIQNTGSLKENSRNEKQNFYSIQNRRKKYVKI